MMVRPVLRAPDPNPEGITELDWVRRIGKRGVGKVERITDNNHAWVDWLGKRSLEPLTWLPRAPSRDLDGKRGEE
jgi:hypothetical protein